MEGEEKYKYREPVQPPIAPPYAFLNHKELTKQELLTEKHEFEKSVKNLMLPSEVTKTQKEWESKFEAQTQLGLRKFVQFEDNVADELEKLYSSVAEELDPLTSTANAEQPCINEVQQGFHDLIAKVRNFRSCDYSTGKLEPICLADYIKGKTSTYQSESVKTNQPSEMNTSSDRKEAEDEFKEKDLLEFLNQMSPQENTISEIKDPSEPGPSSEIDDVTSEMSKLNVMDTQERELREQKLYKELANVLNVDTQSNAPITAEYLRTLIERFSKS